MSSPPHDRSVVEVWLQFESARKDLEQKVHGLELSAFNLTYGPRTELEFRGKLRECRLLLDRLETLLGPEAEKAASVFVG